MTKIAEEPLRTGKTIESNSIKQPQKPTAPVAETATAVVEPAPASAEGAVLDKDQIKGIIQEELRDNNLQTLLESGILERDLLLQPNKS